MPRSPASDTIRAASEALPDDRLELLDVVVVETEADLHGDLEVADRLVGEVATDVGDFEPVKVMQRFAPRLAPLRMASSTLSVDDATLR